MEIGDLRLGCVDEFLNQALWFAEHAGEPGMAPISFSQRIAELVATRFDGFISPGVRGDRDHRYNNVVVVRRASEWRSWVDPKAMPVMVGRSAA
jgi:hypothetical protein